MFYKKVNKNSNKEMFRFLKEHFTYPTLNSWNNLYSIANNVKIYKLDLDWEILDILQLDNYCTINTIIEDWEIEHPGYRVGFNGRSGGYLVLCNENNNKSVLDYYVDTNDNYEDFKREIQDVYGGLKWYKDTLEQQVELVQDFDKLCDNLLEECKYMLKNYKIVEKERTITQKYYDLVEVN